MNTPTNQLHPPVMAPGDYTRYKIILGTLGAVVPLLVAVLFYYKGVFKIDGADAYLHGQLAKRAPWASEVYRTTSSLYSLLRSRPSTGHPRAEAGRTGRRDRDIRSRTQRTRVNCVRAEERNRKVH